MGSPSKRSSYAPVMMMIGSGHGLSHFYLLALPPLFPLLIDEFDTSYAALGFLLTLFNLSSGTFQIPAGFLVDRIGARIVLLGGLAISGLGVALIGLVTSYWMVLALVVFAGVGCSVFHPADYAILSASVDSERLGRAFGVHTFTGLVGMMAAPGSMILMSSLWGWRAALVIAGAFALVVFAAVFMWGDMLKEGELSTDSAEDKATETGKGIRPLLNPAILMLFFFYICTAMVSSGVQTFSVTALVAFQGTGLGASSIVLTAYLVASAVGVLLGGPLADRTNRHGLLAAVAMAAGAAMMAMVGAFLMSFAMVVVLFVLTGFTQGSIRPSRDLMTRAATPPGATGRVFAFVSTGLSIGSAITPVLFGLLIDLGHARWVFVAMGAALLLGVATVGIVRSLPFTDVREQGARSGKAAAK